MAYRPTLGLSSAGDVQWARSMRGLFVSMIDENDSRGLLWHELNPAELVAASVEADGESGTAFLRDLLEVSSAFYGFLAHVGVLRRDEAHPIRARNRFPGARAHS